MHATAQMGAQTISKQGYERIRTPVLMKADLAIIVLSSIYTRTERSVLQRTARRALRMNGQTWPSTLRNKAARRPRPHRIKRTILILASHLISRGQP